MAKERRADIIEGFAQVLSEHGFAGSTMVAVAEAANVSPGLIHHHFRDKREMLLELFRTLVADFKSRLSAYKNAASVTVENYIEAALKLEGRSNIRMAKCWVGVFAEALRDKELFTHIKKHLDSEIGTLLTVSSGKLDRAGASALLSYIIGALVFGAFAPKKTAGFASDKGLDFYGALI